MDLNKLKVPELRKELQSRGLDSKGNKPVLIERLQEALEREKAENDSGKTEEEDLAPSEENSLMYTTADSETAISAQDSHMEEERSFSVITSTASTILQSAPNNSNAVATSEPVQLINEENLSKMGPSETHQISQPSNQSVSELSESHVQREIVGGLDQTGIDSSNRSFDDSSQTPDRGYSTADDSQLNETHQFESEAQSFCEGTNDGAVFEKLPEQNSKFAKDTSLSNNIVMDTAECESGEAAIQSEELMETQEDDSAAEESEKQNRKSRFEHSVEDDHSNEHKTSNAYENDRKRKNSQSASGDQSWSSCEIPSKVAKLDDEPNFDNDGILLSWYDCDLNLTISKDNFISAVPLSEGSFMYMWAGARSNWGFQSGKVYFDVKLLEKNSLSVVEEFEIYSFRLGCSVPYSSRQLGEVPLSYGFDSSGKKCVDNKFEDYGQPFNTGDVVGCLLDFESDDEHVLISFTVNGTSQNAAFEIPKQQLDGKALFPHVLSKNISYEVNFGSRTESWDLAEKFEGDFEWTSKVPLEKRVKGPHRPEQKKDCEVLMMCGLPCSGKTTWIRKHLAENVEKMYNVIGIDDVVSKMKILDESIETHYKDNRSSLVEKCSKLIEPLLDLACIRWRNYILDQTNVASYIQKKRLRSFEGFARHAIVILPKEDDYDKYLERWDENSLRDTSSSLMELKSNFRLPEDKDLFESVKIEGVETREQAEELIRKYNREGRDARPRDHYSHRSRNNDRYGRPVSGGGSRHRWTDRGHPAHPPPISRVGGWGGPRGGVDIPPSRFRDRPRWRDRPDEDRDYRGRYPPRDPSGRYGGSMMSGGAGGRWSSRDRMGPPGRGGPNPLMGSVMGPPRIDDHIRGRGGERPLDNDRPTGGSRFGGGSFRPNNEGGPRSGPAGGYRSRDEGGSRFYSSRGGQPSRDERDGRHPGRMSRPGSAPNRFDKRDSNNASGNGNIYNKSDSNSGGTNQPQGWGTYGQGSWNQCQNWAQYQQAGYSPEQLQQYWSQIQQNSSSSQQTGQNFNSSSGDLSNSSSKSAVGTTNPSQSITSTNCGYNTQGYNTQNYDANTYAQYCAYYSQLATQQGWQQNPDGSYIYPQGAWSQYGYNHGSTGGTQGTPGTDGSASALPNAESGTSGSTNVTISSK